MSEFTFHALNEDLHKALALKPVPFPVRKEREATVFHPDGVLLDQLLVELDVFVRENPALEPHYGDTIGLLGYTVGLDLVTDDRSAEALRCFEIGLSYRPENLSLRVQYALALHSLGRHTEALQQYEYVIRDPDIDVALVIWLAAARLHASTGDPERALELLRDCHRIGFDEPAFLRFLNTTERQLGVPETRVPAATSARSCPQCRKPAAAGRKFCGTCGAPLRPQ